MLLVAQMSRMKTAWKILRQHRVAERGAAPGKALIPVALILGVMISGLSCRRQNNDAPAPAEPATVQLSEGTKSVITHLSQPVEIRFYSLLDPSATSSLSGFAQQVGLLLSAYEQQSGGKIRVRRYDSATNSDPNAALADGIKGFDLDKGAGCYLGVALVSNGKREVLSQLDPEWGQAVEADISRALVQVSTAAVPSNPSATAVKNDAAAFEAVKQQIPDLTSVSLEDGTRLLRESGLKEFAAAVTQMKSEMQEAQQRLEQAHNNGSPADQESAMKHLQEVQTAQSEKLREVAARSQALIATFQQLKAGNN